MFGALLKPTDSREPEPPGAHSPRDEDDRELLIERERKARAVLDLVVQRLFGISLLLDAWSTDIAPHHHDAILKSRGLLDETVELIRTAVLEPGGRVDNLATIQAELLADHRALLAAKTLFDDL